MRIGIDLGGTKIEGVVLDSDNATLAKIRVATPREDYQAIIDTVAQLIAKLESTVGAACSVGIGTPGAISPYSRKMKNSNTVVLNGMDLQNDLELATGKQLYFANDANCLALSESVDGAARGARSVFGVIIGTGTGGGLVYEGQLVSGANAIAGEWGHNPLPYLTTEDRPALRCYCGKSACIETYLSGAGFTRLYERLTGQTLSAADIAARAERREQKALLAIELYAERLARALSTVINVFDPHVVVLAGGLSNLPRLAQLTTLHLPACVFSDHIATIITTAEHGDSSGVRGAAWLPPE
ncbi:MAG: ROK family protein [Gammaproteobacteria bacterium]